MKNILLVFTVLFTLSCTNNGSTTTSEPKINYIKYFSFGAVEYSYNDYMGGRKIEVLMSGILTDTIYPSEESKYRLLDQISTDPLITYHRDYKILIRKTFTFNSYAEASQKRQEILASGIQ